MIYYLSNRAQVKTELVEGSIVRSVTSTLFVPD